VDLLKDGKLHRRFRPGNLAFQTALDAECPDPSNWYVRVTQIDNHVAWSSPIWLG
jgi:hypothetical protein